MTFLEKFAEIKELCNVDVKFDRDFAIQVNMTDEDCCGAFYVEHRGGVVKVEPYDYRDHDAMMTLTSDILYWMLTGEIDSIAAFFEGKFTIDGNVEAVLELMKVTAAIKEKRKAEERAAKEAKKAAEKAAKEAKKAEEKAKKEAEKKAKEAKKAPEKKIAEKKTTKKTVEKEDKQLKLDI